MGVVGGGDSGEGGLFGRNFFARGLARPNQVERRCDWLAGAALGDASSLSVCRRMCDGRISTIAWHGINSRAQTQTAAHTAQDVDTHARTTKQHAGAGRVHGIYTHVVSCSATSIPFG